MAAGQAVDQSNIRNFRDFLLQYNKLTESCFNVCVSNLNNRKSTKEEDSCIDACVNRFVRYNQRAMATFVEAQLKKREIEANEAAHLPFNLQSVEVEGMEPSAAAQSVTEGTEPVLNALENNLDNPNVEVKSEVEKR